MKTTLFFISLIFSITLFSQQQENIESIKNENSKLKEQVKSLKKIVNNLINDTTILKNDTTALRRKLLFCDLYSKPIYYSITNSGKMDFKFVSCNYNIKTKKVRIDFILVNPISDKGICISSPGNYAYDDFGNKYEATLFQREKKGKDDANCFKLISDTPVNGFIEFSDVLPGIDLFKLININYHISNGGGGADSYYIEIKNYKIK